MITVPSLAKLHHSAAGFLGHRKEVHGVQNRTERDHAADKSADNIPIRGGPNVLDSEAESGYV